jgi:hypothetical protein
MRMGFSLAKEKGLPEQAFEMGRIKPAGGAAFPASS